MRPGEGLVVDRRAFLGTLAGGLLTAPLAAEAQPTGKVARVGFLDFGPAPSQEEVSKSPFWVAMKEIGWVEGKTMSVERRYGLSADELYTAAIDLVGLNVDIIVTYIGQSAIAAKKATRTIPIVMAASGDPERQGLIASLAHPGGNVTGLTAISPDISRKRLELLRRAVPKVSRVGVLWCRPSTSTGFTDQEWAETRAAAMGLNVQLVSLELPSCGVSEAECSKAISTAFALAAKERVQAIFVFDCTWLLPRMARIVEFATRNRLPGMYPVPRYPQAGGLMSYSPDFSDMQRRAAMFVDKILKGAKPGDLPVEQPTKFELVINLRTANALGLTIPPSLLQRADQVIE
jgi:putative tryptophan/tyrosine transport system substrate-binding protein